MNISIDLGNFWEMLSGLGTFGAVCLSMWIVRKESKVKIRLLLKEELKKNKDNHSSFSNGDSLLKICAYNSGKTTVGIAFIGFGVGTKKKSFSIKNLMKNKKEIKTYIKYVDQIFDIPKLELIEPGRITEEYTIDKLYLYNTGRKYVEESGNLKVYAEFLDFNGKQYIKEIEIEKPDL